MANHVTAGVRTFSTTAMQPAPPETDGFIRNGDDRKRLRQTHGGDYFAALTVFDPRNKTRPRFETEARTSLSPPLELPLSRTEHAWRD